MGLFDKFKKNSKNVKKENEKINTSSGNLFDEKPKDALTNNMNFDEKLGTYECFLLGKHTVERVCSGLSPLRRDRLWC